MTANKIMKLLKELTNFVIHLSDRVETIEKILMIQMEDTNADKNNQIDNQ